MRKTKRETASVILWDGFRYELRGDVVYGQVHRDSRKMDVVIDEAMAAEARQALRQKAVA